VEPACCLIDTVQGALCTCVMVPPTTREAGSPLEAQASTASSATNEINPSLFIEIRAEA
jgi:hypothetical protein